MWESKRKGRIAHTKINKRSDKTEERSWTSKKWVSKIKTGFKQKIEWIENVIRRKIKKLGFENSRKNKRGIKSKVKRTRERKRKISLILVKEIWKCWKWRKRRESFW